MNQLATIRKKHNLSQTELAKKLDITPQRYNLYEKGRRKLPVEIACKISKLLKVTLDEIFLTNN